MPKKKKSGRKVVDLSVKILQQIRDEGRKTNQRLVETNQRLDGVIVQVDGLRTEMRQGFEKLNRRLDHVFVGPLGQTVRDHERRLRALEKRQRSSNGVR